MFKKKIILLLLPLTFILNVHAQIDTSFWFVAPDISQGLGDRPIYLYFNTYAQAANVNISQPANGSFVPVNLNIPANSIDSINLTPFIASIENNTPNAVLNRGLHISSSQKISVLYSIRAAANREFLSLKGSKALGMDFYVPMQEFWNQAPATSPKSFSSFDIVASENNTTVLITPRTAIIGHAANATFTVLLQRGETFSCQDTARSATTSLAGSIISSNKPLAITIQSSGLNELGCLSSVTDQITSSDYAGTDYVVVRGKASSEKIFVLATQNNTQLTVDDGTVTTKVMNYGENYTYTAAQNITYIKTDKPVYLFHVSGYGCRLSGAQLPPLYCAGTFSTAFTRASSDSLYVNLFTRTGYEGNFALNGNASLVPASAFTVVPGTSGSVKAARILYSTATVPVGSHNVITNSGDVYGLGILNGTSSKGSAYAYTSEFVSYPSINAGSNFTICANGNLVLNGQVGGGNVTGTWSTNGYGSFAAGASALTNTYVPSQLDTTVKPVRIVLTSTGQCPQLKDTLFLSVKPSPLVNASVDQLVCANNANTLLNGSVTGGSSTGIWTSAGTGSFTPSNTTLNATYVPSAADISSGSVKLILASTANGICSASKDSILVSFTPPPSVNIAATTISVCANNPSVAVSGTVTGITTTGKWTTSGTGNFNPSNIQLSTGYIPSAADISAGTIKLYLSSTSNGNCNPAQDSVTIVFTAPPMVNAGPNKSVCKNNMLTVLNGTVSGATSTGVWSGGLGTFSPSNSALTVTYTPTPAEISGGSVNLILTSTANGNCNAVSSNINISFTNPPYVNAGSDLSVCKNNVNTVLSGVVSGTTTTGIWSGGTGTFTPSNSVLNPTYTPTPAEIASGLITLTLTSTNNSNCNAVTDVMQINFTNPPVVNAGSNLSICKNNAATPLNGVVTGTTTTGVWSGGTGSFNPSNSVLNATYTPSASELTAGSVTLTLASSNNGNCNQVTDDVVINFTAPPVVNTGSAMYVCKNNSTSALTGTISGATTTGIWSGGTGTFTPNNTTINANYQPSATELANGSVILNLTSTGNGNCNAVSSNVTIYFTNPPYVNAGADLSVCKNNINTVLSGVVSGTTTTGIWSGGTGTFTPSSAALNPTYTPTPAEIAAGSLTLTLTSTNNANCNAVNDAMVISFINAPIVNAGMDLSSCKNNASTALTGSVTGITTTGVWSGGAGSYNPSNSVLNATYTPNSTELAAGSVTLTLTSSNNGSCNQVTDDVVINFTLPPSVNAGTDVYACKNNASTILTGTVSGATTTGVWSGGTGTFTPNNTTLNASYQPSASELSAGYVNLVLTSTNNGGCVAVSDYMQMFFNNAPIVNAGVDMYACQNNAMPIIAGVITGTTSTGIWSGGAGTYNPSNTALTTTYTPTASELAAGSVTLTLTSTNNGNCNAVVDSMVVFFTNAPVVSAGSDITSCKNNPAFGLSGVVTGPTTTGIWTGGLGSYNPGSTILTATYTPTSAELAAGSVTLVLSSTNNGTCAQTKDTVVVSFINAPVTNAGIDVYSCKNNPLSILSGTVTGPTTTGIWSGGSGTFLPSNTALTATYVPTASEIGAGFVNLTLTSSNNGNCNAVSDIVRVNYMPEPFANFNFNNVCLNLATSFTDFSLPAAGSITDWEWNFGDGSPVDTNATTTHIFPSSGSFTVQLVVKNTYGCSDTIRQSPTVYPLPNANFGITKICNGTDLSLYFSDSSTVNSPEMVNQWFWDFGGPGVSNLHNPTQLYPGSGLYNITLIATTNHNCKDTIVKQINLLPRPIAGFAYSMTSGANVGTTVSFVDTSSYASNWSYNFGDGTGSNLQNPSTVYFDNGVFVVTQIVSDGYGCTDTARVAIKISNITTEISTLIPNAISPNGDGKNDVWKLEFLDLLYPNATVEIYNRWGEQIYTAYNGYKDPWDGTYKGEKLPVGTYYYVLILNDSKNTPPFKGGILLVR